MVEVDSDEFKTFEVTDDEASYGGDEFHVVDEIVVDADKVNVE